MVEHLPSTKETLSSTPNIENKPNCKAEAKIEMMAYHKPAIPSSIIDEVSVCAHVHTHVVCILFV